MLLGQRQHRLRRLHALRDHVHLVDDVVERTALTELDADVPVAALRTAARSDEIAHSREPREREWIATHRRAETSQFREATRNQRGLRVVAVAETVGDPRA